MKKIAINTIVVITGAAFLLAAIYLAQILAALLGINIIFVLAAFCIGGIGLFFLVYIKFPRLARLFDIIIGIINSPKTRAKIKNKNRSDSKRIQASLDLLGIRISSDKNLFENISGRDDSEPVKAAAELIAPLYDCPVIDLEVYDTFWNRLEAELKVHGLSAEELIFPYEIIDLSPHDLEVLKQRKIKELSAPDSKWTLGALEVYLKVETDPDIRRAIENTADRLGGFQKVKGGKIKDETSKKTPWHRKAIICCVLLSLALFAVFVWRNRVEIKYRYWWWQLNSSFFSEKNKLAIVDKYYNEKAVDCLIKTLQIDSPFRETEIILFAEIELPDEYAFSPDNPEPESKILLPKPPKLPQSDTIADRAAQYLGMLKSKKAVPALIENLERKEWAWALGQIGDMRAIERLAKILEILKTEYPDEIIVHWEDSLYRILKKQTIKTLIAALEHKSPEVRSAAAVVLYLRDSKDTEIIKAICKAFNDQKMSLDDNDVHVLLKIKTPRVAEALINILKNIVIY